MNQKNQVLVVEGARPRHDSSLPAAPPESTGMPPSAADNMMAVIARASADRDFDAAKLIQLYTLRDRELARIAEQLFIQAMADFKANPPKIVKDKLVRIPHKNGGGTTEYKHATLGGIVAAVIDGLSKVGISHRWDIDQRDGGVIHVTCVLTHRGGHSIRVPMFAGADDSGSKNNLQSKASTITYLQRYTLMSALGLAAEEDNDGAGAEDNYETITDKQVADLAALLEETGGSKVKLLAYLNLPSLGDIRAENYEATCKMVREQGKKRGAR